MKRDELRCEFCGDGPECAVCRRGLDPPADGGAATVAAPPKAAKAAKTIVDQARQIADAMTREQVLAGIEAVLGIAPEGT